MSKEAMKLALEAAYLAGWNASGEGYNSEYPFGDHARNPEEDAAWIKDRDNALRETLAEQPAPMIRGDIRDGLVDDEPAQQQEPVAWQLIETAPQDGTKILGWNEEFGARETQMNFYGEGSLGFAAWKSGKGSKESGWNWSEPKSNWGHTWEPTHWKPLLTPFNTTPPAAPVQDSDHEFKNFHRSLCERFGYVHDEKDWKRDLVSLEEWIAKKVQPQQEPVAFSQFLSDVVTAAGLLSHGKTDKSLAARISEFAFRLRTSPRPAQQEPVAWALEWTFNGEEVGRRLYDDETHCKFDAGQDGGVCRPLVYGDTPPPAQRKPLTHEQRVDLLAKFEAHKHEWHAPAILIDMVEAAHGIKGDA